MDIQNTSSFGRIELITGCMFASKTSELIHRAKRAEIAGKTVRAFKPEIDDRYSECSICTHTGEDIVAQPIPENESADYILDNIDSSVDVVIIDEGNFFDKSLVYVADELANKEYRVIISGLDQDFRGEPFTPIPELLAISDHVEKRKAICEECGEPATKTQRLIDGEPAPYDSPVVDVGGTEKYEPRCRSCHEVPKSDCTIG